MVHLVKRYHAFILSLNIAVIFFVTIIPATSFAATSWKRYFAHEAVEDQYGVIAPWYQGLNGQCDLRIRIAAETLKRYPWTDPQKNIVVLPAYLVNGSWKIAADGTITVNNAEPGEWNNGDYGQRLFCSVAALTDYYKYSGDPVAIAHIKLQIDHMLDYTLTGPDHPWPGFPISVPIKAKGYTYFDSHKSIIQLDIAAEEGTALLKAYQLTGEIKWFETAKHWGDLFAKNRNPNPAPGTAPWNRYATAENSPPWDNKLTGGIAYIQEFLDELVRLGYNGQNNEILKTTEQCRAYLRDVLLPVWAANDSWARNFWDWQADAQCLFPTDAVVRCLMARPDYFQNWQVNVRNILTIFLNHSCVDSNGFGDTYSGAWAYPESFNCCRSSLDYSPMCLAGYYGQYGVLANNEWAKEMARRQIIITTYHFHENGVVEDDIKAGQIVANDWFKIAHPMAMMGVINAIGWLPEILGANRENHIVRSSCVVNSVIYGKDTITYSTFDAPANTVDVLRLAFVPKSITADGKALPLKKKMSDNGYTVKKLSNGDSIVSVRHDGKKTIVITGKDPQQISDDDNLQYSGSWRISDNGDDSRGQMHVSETDGATVICKFNGNQVRLTGCVDSAGGLADVYLDNTKQPAGIDCWNPSLRHQQILYYRNGLSNGDHELKIVVRGSKNPVSNGNNIYIDTVQYSNATGDNGFGCGGGPANTQRMVFGYTNQTAYIDSSDNEWLPGTEFVVRSGASMDSVEKAWWTKPAGETVSNTKDPDLYRYGVHAPEFWVNTTVGPGKYYVQLKFAANRDIDYEKQGVTILINGEQVVSQMNVAATAGGKNKAVDLVFNNILPRNGVIEIRFVGNSYQAQSGIAAKGEAFVQAIEIGRGNGGKGATPISIK